MTTYRKVNTTCPECKSNNILKDTVHDETFCNHCGLIIQDNSLTLITSVIKEETRNEQRLRKLLWHKYHVKGE